MYNICIVIESGIYRFICSGVQNIFKHKSCVIIIKSLLLLCLLDVWLNAVDVLFCSNSFIFKSNSFLLWKMGCFDFGCCYYSNLCGDFSLVSSGVDYLVFDIFGFCFVFRLGSVEIIVNRTSN